MKEKLTKVILSKHFARGFALVAGATMGFLLCDIGRHSGFVEGMNWMDGRWKDAVSTLKDQSSGEETTE